jgi:uncharacterized LabA/DUF88 family protein
LNTIVYVDGYNLFYGCLKHTSFKWLDIVKLMEGYILHAQNPKINLINVKYFTADILAKFASNGQQAHEAQKVYHRALQLLYPNRFEIIKGYYSDSFAKLPVYRKPPDKLVTADVWKLEEKKTDVNIALHMYSDAIKGNAEQIVIVSNDTDLEPSLQMIRSELGDTIKIGVIIPIKQPLGKKHRPPNQQLSKYADWTRKYITNDELEKSQLPAKIPTKKKPILKPKYW